MDRSPALAGLALLAVSLYLFLRRWPSRSLSVLAVAGLLLVAADALAGAHLPFRLWHLLDGGEGGGVLVVNLRAHASFFLKLAGVSLLFGALYANLQASLGSLRLIVLPAHPVAEDTGEGETADAATGRGEAKAT